MELHGRRRLAGWIVGDTKCRYLILAGFLFAGCGLTIGGPDKNPLFWDMLILNAIPLSSNEYIERTCELS